MDTCPICKGLFERHYRQAGQKQIYCSKRCRYFAEYEECVCKTCGKTYQRNKLSKKSAQYCSVACIQRYPCLFCGKIIVGRVAFQSHKNRKAIQYCSKQCAAIATSTLTGDLNYVVRGFAATILRNGKLACERCGFDDPDGLIVHHRDRDRENNEGSNLETLCGTCHILEHGRGSRKKAISVRNALLIAQFAPEKI
jgi:hypothetical protein